MVMHVKNVYTYTYEQPTLYNWIAAVLTLSDRPLICSVIILAFDTPLTKKLFRRRLPTGSFLLKLHSIKCFVNMNKNNTIWHHYQIDPIKTIFCAPWLVCKLQRSWNKHSNFKSNLKYSSHSLCSNDQTVCSSILCSKRETHWHVFRKFCVMRNNLSIILTT